MLAKLLVKHFVHVNVVVNAHLLNFIYHVYCTKCSHTTWLDHISINIHVPVHHISATEQLFRPHLIDILFSSASGEHLCCQCCTIKLASFEMLKIKRYPFILSIQSPLSTWSPFDFSN